MKKHIEVSKTRKWLITACVIGILACAPSVSAQTGSTWGDSALTGTRESSSTDVRQPGRYAFDSYASTAWSVAEGSTNGWVERYWSEAQSFLGAEIEADIPEDAFLQLYYEADGHWVAIPGSLLSGPKRYRSIVEFPLQMPKVSKMLCVVVGSRADEVRVWNIKWTENNRSVPYGKIYPETYRFNQEEYINLKPDRLWDESVGNAWYEPLGVIQDMLRWFTGNQGVAQFFSSRSGHPRIPAEIIWELDGEYTVDLLKVLFHDRRGEVQFEFWDGEAWSDRVSLRSRWQSGWEREALHSPVTTERIRITFPGGWESARGVDQLEVWAEGLDKRPLRPLVIGNKAEDGQYHVTFVEQSATDYQVQVIVKGHSTEPLTASLNGKALKEIKSTDRGEESLHWFEITGEQLFDGTQFLALGGGAEIRGAMLQKRVDRGLIELGGHYSDGYVTGSDLSDEVPVREKSWDLGGRYQLERVRLFLEEGAGLRVQAGIGRRMENIPVSYNRIDNCWEADITGLEADSLIISSDTPFRTHEVEVLGTALEDKKPRFEVWWPTRGGSLSVDGQGTGIIFGWAGNPQMQMRVGGRPMQRTGSLFWAQIGEAGFTDGDEFEFPITGEAGGYSASRSIRLRRQGQQPIATLDQDVSLVSVNGDSIALSGTVSMRNARVFVQGEELPIQNNRFAATVALAFGYQHIDIKVTDRHNRTVLASFRKPVYRTSGAPLIALDLPFGDLWTQGAVLPVSGRVGNGRGLVLAINDEPVELEADSFEKIITLAEGTQSIKITVTDESGRRSERILRVYRDSTAPEIEILQPTEGQYLRSSAVLFRVSGKADSALWWRVNADEWEYSASSEYLKTLQLRDGFYAYTVQAQDRSGNLSAAEQRHFCVDTTPPESFPLVANVEGWTNNTGPVITFATSDATSGLSGYEYRLDGEEWAVCESPLELENLTDGIHTLFVRATDSAGNTRIESLPLQIDTSAPPLPTHFRPVPGVDHITLKWEGVDDGESFQSYRIERLPAWEDGVRSVGTTDYGKQEYRDVNLTLKDEYSYRLWSVDRAGNVSTPTEWVGAMVGLASVPISESGETVVEYDQFMVTLPQGAVADDIIRIQINEIPEEALSDTYENPVVSKVFQVTVVRQDESGEYVTEHADLLLPVVVAFDYDESRIPEGYQLLDLSPFYYDDLWGRWVPYERAFIDTTTDTMRFSTNHFTDMSIQATKAANLTPDQLRDVEFSPYSSNIGHGEVNVSTNGGSVSTTFTELILPGKNGLDLVLKRTYDTVTAEADAFERVPDEKIPGQMSVYKVNGDLPWIIADGWRLNFPSMKWNSSGLWMTDLDGNRLSFDQLSLFDSSRSGDTLTVTMENHEGADLKAVIHFGVDDPYNFLGIIPIGSTSYKMSYVELFMKDGRVLRFDSKGRISRISDSTGLNQIVFHYRNDTEVASITDSMGRVISFEYLNSAKVNGISEITVSESNAPGSSSYPVIRYARNGTNLSTATDVGGRIWSYQYQTHEFVRSNVLLNPPDSYRQPKEKKAQVNALRVVSGPGIGRTEILCNTSVQPYRDYVDNYEYDVSRTYLQARRLTVFEADTNTESLRTTQYSFTRALYAGTARDYYTTRSIVNDGRIRTTTDFSVIGKKRNSLSQAPEALKRLLHYEDPKPRYTGEREKEIEEVLNYITEIQTETVIGNTISRETQQWNTATMKLTGRSVVKASENRSVSEYQYDSWGNITRQSEDSVVAGSRLKTVSNRVYLRPGVTLATIGQGMSVPASLTEVNSGVPFTRTDLLASRKTDIYSWNTEDSSDESANSITEFELYTYNTSGQLASRATLLEDTQWALRSYSYDSATGQIETVTEPGPNGLPGQVSRYVYSYPSQSGIYQIRTTAEAVQLDGGDFDSRVSIVKEETYSTLSGKLTESRDAEGLVTTYLYDTLGRPETVRKYNENNPEEALSEVGITYNDAELWSRVTNELGGETTYQFDSLGRLTSVVKVNDIVSELLSPITSEEITTTLEYDGYDQVIEMHGPYSTAEVVSGRSLATLVTSYAYDLRGRITSVTAPGMSKSRTYFYEDSNNRVIVTDEEGRRTATRTDWSGNVVLEEMFVDGVPLRVRSFYDGLGRIVSRRDPENNVTDYTYNRLGLEATITESPRTVYENDTTIANVRPVTSKKYNPDGSLRSVSKQLDASETIETVYTVNGLGWVLSTTAPVTSDDQPQNLVGRFSYDRNGNKLSELTGYATDSELKGKRWQYDDLGRVEAEIDELGQKTSYAYDAAGNRTGVIDPRQGNAAYASEFMLTLKYDQFGRLIKGVLPKADRSASGEGPAVLLSYDGRGNLIARQEPDGVRTEYQYTLQNWLERETVRHSTADSPSYVTTHTYDATGKEKTVEYPTGRIVRKNYDSAGRVQFQGSDDAGWTGYTYDGNHNVLTITDPMERVTSFTYTPEKAVLTVTDPMGNISYSAYDRLGQLRRTQDNEENVRTFDYDELGRLIQSKNPQEKNLVYSYDGWGNVRRFTDARGTVFTRTYTRTNLIESEQARNTALGMVENVSYTYDEAGDTKSVTNGETTSFNLVNGTYQPNPFGMLSGVSWAQSEAILSMGYTYDERQRLTAVSVNNGTTYEYGYNSIGELSTVSDWVQGNLSYDAGGRLSGYTLANGVTKSYAYDREDRVSGLTFTGSQQTILKDYQLTYDTLSNLVSKNDNRYTYDSLNRLETATERGWFQQQPEDISPAYSAYNRDYTGLSEVSIPLDDQEITVSFDYASRGISCDLRQEYGVNKLELQPLSATHRVREQDIAIYAKASSVSPDVSETWVRLENWTMEKNALDGSLVIHFPEIVRTRYIKVTSIWDDRNTLNESIADYATFTNRVSSLLRVWTLTEQRDESYAYDRNGNRLTQTVNGQQVSYTYYTNGNGGNLPLIQTDGQWRYQYDANGNRISKESLSTSGETWSYTWDLHNRLINVTQGTAVSVSYAYDALNYRVRRDGKDGTTVYAYGRSGALTYQRNAQTGLERSFVYLNNQIIGWTDTIDGVSTTYYAITDHLGSVTAITDASGTVLWQSEYLPFGNLAGAEGEVRFEGLYTGKDIDSETGLTYHWNRWRSEDGSTFISEDPAQDGMNWYGYCGANPMNATDPTGLLADESWKSLIQDMVSGRGSYDDLKTEYEGREREQIAETQQQLENLAQDSWTGELRDDLNQKLDQMMADYNRDVVPKSADDYGATGITGNFEDENPYFGLGQDPHPGTDIVGGTGFQTPWYTKFEGANTNQGSNPFVLSVPGTPYRIRTKHGDTEAVNNLAAQGQQTFSPGQQIIATPQNQNPEGVGIHFHVEIRTTAPNAASPLVNPIGLSPGTYSTYQFQYPEPFGWGSMNTMF